MRGWIAGLVLILTSPVWAAECIDGDTLIVDGTDFRLDGIDARDALAKLTANCATVRCEDKGPDTVYHRRIGLCTAAGLRTGSAADALNEWLVREGWALNFEPYAKGRYLVDRL